MNTPIAPYAVFDGAGTITKTGSVARDELEHQAGPGEMVIETEETVNDRYFYVLNGEVVPKTSS